MSKHEQNIGLFYGSSTCYTEMAAEKIRDALHPLPITLFNIADTDIALCEQYTHLIFGIPTWDYGELQEDWENCWEQIDNIDFNGKKVALFGLGDQIGYPEWFLDAMGYLHNKLLLLGADMIGYTPSASFEFDESKALTEDGLHFVGLALDEENEFDKTAERINSWAKIIAPEFKA